MSTNEWEHTDGLHPQPASDLAQALRTLCDEREAEYRGTLVMDFLPIHAIRALLDAHAAPTEAAEQEPEPCPCPDLAGDCPGDHTAAIAACPSRVDHPLMEACGSCAYRYGGPR